MLENPISAPVYIVRNADLDAPADARAVVELLDHYARDPMGGGKPLAPATRENLVPALRARPGTHVLLAFAGEEPVGLVIAFEGFSTFAAKPLLNIHDVVVAAAHRGRGISRRMFDEIEAIAEHRGCCKITLEVLEGNTQAQAAYKAFGFKGYELDPKTGRAMFWEKKL